MGNDMGMTPPVTMDENDPAEIKKWQESIMDSVRGGGFSPLPYLMRPSATKASGFNTFPHDGNPARAGAPDAPPSWSSCVMAMTCDFETVKGYSTLDSVQSSDTAGLIMLVKPKEVNYLSSGDVAARHEVIKSDESEVITPHIDGSDVLAILFIEQGKISRVEINANAINDKTSKDEFGIDKHLVENLNAAREKATPEALEQLDFLIYHLERQTNKVDLMEEFNSRYNKDVDELIDHTKRTNAKCDAEIEAMPGIIGAGLRAIKRENPIKSREELAAQLELPLPDRDHEDDEDSSLDFKP